MKILKYFPILFLFILSSCNPDKETILPQGNNGNANSRMQSFLGPCDIPGSTNIAGLGRDLVAYLNCITPICEHAYTLPYNAIYTFTTTQAAPYNLNSSEFITYVNQVEAEANIHLADAKSNCPSAIISGYTLQSTPTLNGNNTYTIRIVIWYSCCDGKPID